MFGDGYPTKYMGKTTDTFGRMKFWLSQTYRFKPKLMLQVENARYRVIDATFKLHAESSKVFLWNAWNVLTRMHRRKKKTTLPVHPRVEMIKSLLVPNCLILRMNLMDSVVV